MLWGGRNTEADTTGVCEECTQCLSHTGFAPLTGVCAFPVYIAQAPGCSAGELSKAGPGLHALPRSKPLRFRFLGTPQGHRLSWACVLCPPRSKQLMWPGAWRAHSPSWAVRLITSPCPSPLLSWVHSMSAVSGIPCVSSGELISVTLLADVNRPGSQEDLVSNWEPALSLVEDAVSGAEIAPCLLVLPVAHLLSVSSRGRDQSTAC